jgi:hypothetical protein
MGSMETNTMDQNAYDGRWIRWIGKGKYLACNTFSKLSDKYY